MVEQVNFTLTRRQGSTTHKFVPELRFLLAAPYLVINISLWFFAHAPHSSGDREVDRFNILIDWLAVSVAGVGNERTQNDNESKIVSENGNE